ncbi:hypothetical protein HBHAL_4079 [Halobacillus halophilus DSM 2266]|uniref:Uncharacterized protein n=1 Tax=Halobacillus halophilus (strain ATCC 35676 / DSM 2266 / JCM 20832 / KCTC 3685 / LMG 17431 / NBRC 102448 / NCIMB 2269) TaxID=866895 RepID=I0JQK0_HALH3|nr:hypothetical protein HBHAL_4079 [Halobacillus halophilus DSM 2266]
MFRDEVKTEKSHQVRMGFFLFLLFEMINLLRLIEAAMNQDYIGSN